jgi:xanthine dehydrogenase YagS FAD-binding subunit
MKTSARGIDEARIVVNGVSGRPRRLRDVEDAVRGQTPNEATATLAGDLAVKNAEPLRDNAYKVAMTRNLVRRAVRVGAETTT